MAELTPPGTGTGTPTPTIERPPAPAPGKVMPNRVQEYRLMHHMSIRALAEVMRWNYQYLRRVETGQQDMWDTDKLLLALFFGVEVDDIFPYRLELARLRKNKALPRFDPKVKYVGPRLPRWRREFDADAGGDHDETSAETLAREQQQLVAMAQN